MVRQREETLILLAIDMYFFKRNLKIAIGSFASYLHMEETMSSWLSPVKFGNTRKQLIIK